MIVIYLLRRMKENASNKCSYLLMYSEFLWSYYLQYSLSEISPSPVTRMSLTDILTGYLVIICWAHSVLSNSVIYQIESTSPLLGNPMSYDVENHMWGDHTICYKSIYWQFKNWEWMCLQLSTTICLLLISGNWTFLVTLPCASR